MLDRKFYNDIIHHANRHFQSIQDYFFKLLKFTEDLENSSHADFPEAKRQVAGILKTYPTLKQDIEFKTESSNPEIPDYPPSPKFHFTQKAMNDLYAEGHYIAINGNIYHFSGTHYQIQHPDEERRRIAEWANTTPAQMKNGTSKYAYATPEAVNKIWNWALAHLAISPDKINPPGLNLKNGTLKLSWEGKKVTWKLHPHSPDDYYTYCSDAKYDPRADQADCERLLACLEPEQQTIFMRTIAASIDLNKIREFRGREIKALLLQGYGSNGKDALREAVATLFDQNMTHVTIGDLQAYDQGRKFPVAKLAGKTISWASENGKFASLDNLQSLKAAITGERIDIEVKNRPEYSVYPATVFLFNCNDLPSLKGGLEALSSRWGILRFTKTYKINADPEKGEIEADSRFRYSPMFLKEKVVPALLNRILAELQLLIDEGINYASIADSMQQLQNESNHLWSFCREKGLDYSSNGKVYIKDVWEELRQWYIHNGTLEIVTLSNGSTKDIWHDQVYSGDKNVKAVNKVYKRLAELFPKIKRAKETVDRSQIGNFYLSGIAFFAPHDAKSLDKISISEATALTVQGCGASEVVEAVSEAIEAVSEATTLLQPLLCKGVEQVEQIGAVSGATTLTVQGCGASGAKSEINNKFEKNNNPEINNPEMQHNFTSDRADFTPEEEKDENSTPKPKNHTFEVGDRVIKKGNSGCKYQITELPTTNYFMAINKL